jgi:hypothetical protein
MAIEGGEARWASSCRSIPTPFNRNGNMDCTVWGVVGWNRFVDHVGVLEAHSSCCYVKEAVSRHRTQISKSTEMLIPIAAPRVGYSCRDFRCEEDSTATPLYSL